MDNAKETIDRLIQIGGELEKPETIHICGRTYCTKSLNRIDSPVYAEPLRGQTLSGLLDYAEHVLPIEGGERCYFMKIESHRSVSIVGVLDKDARREVLYRAEAITSEFRYDSWYTQEQFVIALQANFMDTHDLDAVKTVSGNVKAETVATYGDDGVTQKATINVGVATAENIIVPNPVLLRPYRTFLEVEQPCSPFVFRLQANGAKNDRPEFKLVAADGDVWVLEAIQNIRSYLKDEIEKRGIDIMIIG